jgi:hypothetical protein
VDEANPFDKLQLTVTLPSADALFKAKRDLLDKSGLSTMQVGRRAGRAVSGLLCFALVTGLDGVHAAVGARLLPSQVGIFVGQQMARQYTALQTS